jgi:hypothetical protein
MPAVLGHLGHRPAAEGAVVDDALGHDRHLLVARVLPDALPALESAVNKWVVFQFVPSRSLVRQITAPMALTEPAQEASFPGQAKTVYGWLRTHPKTLIDFTVAQGAQLHCEPMAPTVRNDAVFDWVETNLRPVA